MDNTTQILFIVSVSIQIILFIALIIAVISVSKLVKNLMGKVDNLTQDFNNYKTKIDPIIEQTKGIVQKISDITDKVSDNVDYVKKATANLKKITDDMIDFKERLMAKAEPPIFDTISAFTAIVKGVKSFSDSWNRNRPVKKPVSYSDDNLLFDNNGEVDSEIEKQYDDINKELNEVRKKLEEMKKV